nr:MAG TPA: hypothetical protein [Bacteriophage sp.]
MNASDSDPFFKASSLVYTTGIFNLVRDLFPHISSIAGVNPSLSSNLRAASIFTFSLYGLLSTNSNVLGSI